MPPWAEAMGNAQPRASHHHHHQQHHQQRGGDQHQQPQQHHHHQRRNRRESSVDLAAVTEAHGLVSDMLADPQLPPHIVTGLRTLSALLSPPAASSSSCCPPPRAHHRRSPQRRKGSLILPSYFRSSDSDEIPFTGERPSALPKRLRKNLAPSVLRRMSTATWTTTTSATGMPTLEPEPLRKRSTSFRNLQSPPSSLQQDEEDEKEDRQFSPGLESLIAALPEGEKPRPKDQRSFSTTALPSGHPKRRDSRGRKTVASLHPLTPHDVQSLARMHDAATQQADDADQPPIKEEEEEEDEEEEEEGLPPLPSFRRPGAMLASSDCESSDSPPSGPEDGGRRHVARAHASSQTTPSGPPCALCGGRTPAPFSPSPLLSSGVPQETEPEEEDNGAGVMVRLNDAEYDLEILSNDPLLGLIDIWDFPVFDMERQAGTHILSQMCYRVFLATGLFESFRIPLNPFFAYFHELEKGYRDKPYHNRMHASDVLHGVYFLISQPIPGFNQVSSDSTDSPLHRTLSGREVQDRWPSSRQGTLDEVKSFIDDEEDEDDEDSEDEESRDVYGVMGANFPALEIMALYAAAAMHDYDHPGRTNAFLVATFSPKAVLYNDRSVLENHHAAAAWSLLLSDERYNWLRYLDEAEFKRFRFLVIELILATDLKRHFDILTDFNAKMCDEDSPPLDWTSEADRMLVMQMAIKLSDINGPCKCRQLHMQWTHRIAEEFYEQGDEERSLGLPISRYMDRDRPQLAKLQESFIGHLVAPLCRSYAEAALLPGVWVRLAPAEQPSTEELSEDDLDLPRRFEEVTASGKRQRRECKKTRRKAVHCQQTKNLQDNYDYWMAVQRREEEQEQVVGRGTRDLCT